MIASPSSWLPPPTSGSPPPPPSQTGSAAVVKLALPPLPLRFFFPVRAAARRPRRPPRARGWRLLRCSRPPRSSYVLSATAGRPRERGRPWGRRRDHTSAGRVGGGSVAAAAGGRGNDDPHDDPPPPPPHTPTPASIL
ncbi:hypothetical protein I4F81_005666 [Pyropia yezoensis]|uniref:Uncharacterized protein n=1 Tax=Pyropia yezoensis TaxID=2788 RepID=A0ACC3BZY4_PYRYE|nr:hypothetical protein I4F81_005666 [Neopyropia yezoensis]